MPPSLHDRPVSFSGLKTPGLVVGLGEARALKVGLRQEQAGDVLVAFGLGSCVALCLWDAAAGVAGMAHIVLPGADPCRLANPRFARSALPALVALMHTEGATADPRRLVARLAGGSQILTLDASHGFGRIGVANATAILEVLAEAGVEVEASDLGGSSGRNVWFDPRAGGRIRVRTIGSSTDRYL